MTGPDNVYELGLTISSFLPVGPSGPSFAH